MARITDKQIIKGSDKSKVDKYLVDLSKSQFEDLKACNIEDFEKLINENPTPAPRVFSKLVALEKCTNAKRKDVYEVIRDLTPYLLRRLVYESYKGKTSFNRTQATKIILDKILPNVSASEVKLTTEDIQSLVIVKASNKSD